MNQELSGWVPEQLESRSRCLSLKYKSDSAFGKVKGKQQELDFWKEKEPYYQVENIVAGAESWILTVEVN